MQIGLLSSISNIKASSPRLPEKNTALENAFANIATPSPRASNTPSAAGSSPLSSSMTATFLKTQEFEDKTSLESQFEAMFEGSAPEEMISEISSMSGFMKWQIKELTKKAAADVMGAMGISMDDLKAMPAEQKLAVMKHIMDAVQEKVKLAMEEQMKKQNKEGIPLASSQLDSILG